MMKEKNNKYFINPKEDKTEKKNPEQLGQIKNKY